MVLAKVSSEFAAAFREVASESGFPGAASSSPSSSSGLGASSATWGQESSAHDEAEAAIEAAMEAALEAEALGGEYASDDYDDECQDQETDYGGFGNGDAESDEEDLIEEDEGACTIRAKNRPQPQPSVKRSVSDSGSSGSEAAPPSKKSK